MNMVAGAVVAASRAMPGAQSLENISQRRTRRDGNLIKLITLYSTRKRFNFVKLRIREQVVFDFV
jgi:hypothetical protein